MDIDEYTTDYGTKNVNVTEKGNFRKSLELSEDKLDLLIDMLKDLKQEINTKRTRKI